MEVPAASPFCETTGDHACVSLPANEIVNATALRLCSMHKYELFDRTYVQTNVWSGASETGYAWI
jgi:hypothetical protein